MKYSPPLDGLRGIAVLAVVAFHIAPTLVPGGFVGVDVFFVLSGYLICSILINDIANESFSFRDFYIRRIQRLLPNLLATLLFVTVLWTLLLPSSAAIRTAQHSAWSLFSASNFFIWKYFGGYWGDAAESAPLTHTWSLGVEEQFYLIFPSVLLLILTRRPKWLPTLLAAAIILSFGASMFLTARYPTLAFYALPTRGWELLLGVALAVQRFRRATPRGNEKSLSATFFETFGWVGLAVTLSSFFLIDETIAFPGWIALLPALSTLLVLIAIADDTSSLGKALSFKPLVSVGRTSYSLYLWHWPLIILGKTIAEQQQFAHELGAIYGGVAGVVLGIGAYYFVERPLRQRGEGQKQRLGFIGGIFTATVITTLAFGYARRPVADPNNLFDQPTFSGRLYDAAYTGDVEPQTSTRYYDVYFPPRPPGPADLWKQGGLLRLYGSVKPEVVVLGSSHALMYAPILDEIARTQQFSIAFLAIDGGRPALFKSAFDKEADSPQKFDDFDTSRRRWITEWRPRTVVLIDRWDERVSSPSNLESSMREFINWIDPLVSQVIFVAQVPTIHGGNDINLREQATWEYERTGSLPKFFPDSREQRRKESVQIATSIGSKYVKLKILRPDLEFYNQDGSVRYFSGRSFFYADDDHLSDIGTAQVRHLFEAAFAQPPTP